MKQRSRVTRRRIYPNEHFHERFRNPFLRSLPRKASQVEIPCKKYICIYSKKSSLKDHSQIKYFKNNHLLVKKSSTTSLKKNFCTNSFFPSEFVIVRH